MNVLGQIFLCASVFMIVGISCERRFAICSPHAYRIHVKTTPLWKHLMMYLTPVLSGAIAFNIPYIINVTVSRVVYYSRANINSYLDEAAF